VEEIKTKTASDVMIESPHILAVDDEVMLHDVLERLFPREGIQVTTCSGGTEAVELLEEHAFDLVLTDLQMPEMDGLELLAHTREHHPDLNVVVLSAHDNVQQAVRAMREGAVDYIPKPFSTDELVDRIKGILREQAEQENEPAPPEGDSLPDTPPTLATGESRHNETEGDGVALSSEAVDFVGEHRSVQRLKEMIPRVARSRAPVFIHGESGTGKEILSRLIHDKSDRADGPYVPINCAALPSDLVESHLFGHVEGAFTGAVDDMEGAFEKADGGTLLLDEVTEISCAVQAKLLRVLQNQEFQKVGASEKKRVDVRVVATSNRDLKEAVQEGAFREDLYHRLAVFPMHVPPLRGRLSDIPLLAEHFIEKYASQYGLDKKTISPGLLQYFQTYSWPGNVRELENMIHRGVVMAADNKSITQEDVLNSFFSDEAPDGRNGQADGLLDQITENGDTPTIDEMERKLILSTLAKEDISQKRAAEKLGVSPRTIRNKLQEYRSQGFSV